jgi:hypothetical protein
VHDLRLALGGEEETVWFDTAGSLIPGDTFINKIREEVRERPVFVVIVSPDSMRSRFVDYEVSLAFTYDINSPGGKLIVPVLYRECELRDDLGMRHGISFLPPRRYEDALSDLLTVVNQAQ